MFTLVERKPELLLSELKKNIQQFEFFQAVRLLEKNKFQSSQGMTRPIGYDFSPCQELIRFHGAPSLGFPASPIASLIDNNEKIILQIAFMGLFGSNGVLPDHYTELLIRRLQLKDTGLKDFLDVFNHRLISLFYRSWKKTHFYVDYHSVHNQQSTFIKILNAWLGTATASHVQRLSVEDETILHYGGLFQSKNKSLNHLMQILSDYFSVKITIKQFVGNWLAIAKHEYMRLTENSFNCLGENSLLGNRVWDVQSKFQIVIGPLNYQHFLEFLPTGIAIRRLIDLVQRFCRVGLHFDVRLILKADEIPRCQLSKKLNLGWNMWLKTKKHIDDVNDTVITVKN